MDYFILDPLRLFLTLVTLATEILVAGRELLGLRCIQAEALISLNGSSMVTAYKSMDAIFITNTVATGHQIILSMMLHRNCACSDSSNVLPCVSSQ